MAGSSAVRLRLRFDYPPPSGTQCRMSWILLDQNRCRVIADLCSEIRERFGFSRRAELDLFIEECYLPPAESIYLIRDNDSIRVKVSGLSCLSASEERATSGRKRSRKDEDEEQQLQGVAVGPKKKSKSEDTAVNGLGQHEETKKKRKKKNKKVEKQTEAATEPGKEPESFKIQTEKTSRKAPGSSGTLNSKAPKTSSKQKESSDSSDSEEETPQRPPPKPKPKPKTPPKQTVVAKAKESTSSESSSSSDEATSKPSKPRLPVRPSPVPLKPTSTNSKPSAKKLSTQPSSDSSLSSSPSPPARKAPPPSAAQNGPPPTPSTPVSKNNEKVPESSDSDSSSETELVIKTPNPQVLGMTPRGGGRVRGRGGVRGGFGRARGTPWKQNIHYNYDSGEQQKQDDSQTNRSLVLENPPEPKPRRDYSALPLLAAPPAAGQKIAFKLLELTENYTPEVSDYKEGRIVGFNHTTGMIELELLTQAQARAEPGKFDLVYQNPDGSERVEYAVTLGSQVTERWDSLLEPRLIVESSG
ncbi:coilin [Salminus brasiliensis]|uniref:coilin n=1 Tax=Salminus brasiliensis TaxID=930266 RepID=UPI003B82F688